MEAPGPREQRTPPLLSTVAGGGPAGFMHPPTAQAAAFQNGGG